MIIKEFQLHAFGPFTETGVDCSDSVPGLHVVYGPNESGKSSMLRALKAWLFGFPERTLDNFLHANSRLSVSGTLVDNQGGEVGFARRKKRKGSVLDLQGNVLDEGRIRSWLQGLDQNTFEILFGLDHAGLVRGGTAILQEKGSAGTTLFSAGTGIASVERILAELKEESRNIFKSQGSKPELNAALSRYKELKKEINQAVLSSHAWKERERALRQAENDLEEIRIKKKDFLEEEQRLRRLQQAMKPVANLQKARGELKELGFVPWLPEDFPDRRRNNLELHRQAEKTLTLANNRLNEIKSKMDAIELNKELLAQAETIYNLHQRLGAYRKGLADRSGLEEARLQKETAAAEILYRVRPDLRTEQVQEVRDLLSRRREILAHGQKLEVLDKEFRDSSEALQSMQEELNQKKADLDALPLDRDITALNRAIEDSAHLGDVDTQLDNQKQQASKDKDRFSAAMQRLGFWQGTPEELLNLPLPLDATLRRFKRDWEALEQEERQLAEQKAELIGIVEERRKDLHSQELAGDVPTEEDLKAKRAWREKGWALIRRKWLEVLDVQEEAQEYAPESPLDQVYEHAVQEADHTADRLRWESARVHEKARLQSELEQARQQLEDLGHTEADLSRKWEDLKAEWSRAWQKSGIEPEAPEAMLDWLGSINQWLITAQQIVDNEAATVRLEEKRKQARRDLEVALLDMGVAVPQGVMLAPVLKLAQETKENQKQVAHRRQTLKEAIDRLERDMLPAGKRAEEAQAALTSWQEEWRNYLEQLGLSTSETPDGVADFFEELEKCVQYMQEASGYARRVEGIDRDSRELKKDVAALLERVAPELKDLPVDQAVESVKDLLDQNQANKTSLSNYRESMENTEKEIEDAENDREYAVSQLNELCSLAGCESFYELEAVEKKWLRQQELQEIVSSEKANLQEIAPAHNLEDLIAEVESQDPDSLAANQLELEEELKGLEKQFEEQSRTVGELRREFQEMDGSDQAARKAEEAEEVLTVIRGQAERFTRLCLASKVLEEAIERYRAENQDPVLALGSQYFQELTANSFQGLRTDVDDKGEQVIVGLRDDGTRVQVEGMSDGTRDQLYLSLRLASLEYRLDKAEPMPFIVDDILVNFDEERVQAALKAMARLGEKNQVLLFTHHRQIADSTRKLDLGKVHSLGFQE